MTKHIPYGFNADQQVGRLVVPAAHKVRENFEVPFWFRDHIVQPGEYVVYGKPNGYGQTWYAVVLDTIVEDACFVSRIGSHYGRDNGPDEIGKPSTKTISHGAYYDPNPAFHYERSWCEFHELETV